MSRAAILAAGATLMAAGAACDSDPPKTGDAATMSDSAIDDNGAGGAIGSDDAGGTDLGNTTDSAANDRGVVALYGAVPEYGAPPASQKKPDNT